MDIGIAFQLCACGAQLCPPVVLSPGVSTCHEVEREYPPQVPPSHLGVSDSEWKRERRPSIIAQIKKEITDIGKSFKSSEITEDEVGVRVRLERHEALVEGSEESGHLSLKCPQCGRVTFDWKRSDG